MADLAADFTVLDPCVHCGLCLPACPTYTATGDESDSPRGRIVLMRALERGEVAATDTALRQHLDRCLGCRGCEPACPSGVGYGRGLETARGLLARANGIPAPTRAVLSVFGIRPLWRAVFGGARVLRSLGVADRFSGSGRLGAMLSMVAATRWGGLAGSKPAPADSFVGAGSKPAPADSFVGAGSKPAPADSFVGAGSKPAPADSFVGAGFQPARTDRGTVALFRGCVMDVLFDHVHAATRRTLEVNGYKVVEAAGQVCCGAPHEHAGDGAGARRLAANNVTALAERADLIVVNSAGCGAMLRDYGHLMGDAAARSFAAKVRDISELLADAGPVRGASVEREVAYDAPCHLQHAQRVHAQPLALLRSIPGLRLRLLPGHDRCCGGAGAYSMLQPEMSALVLADKIASIRAATPRPDLVATGNPGCIMQIGAGLRAAGLAIPVVHPVELLDLSYAGGGLYG